MQIEHKTNIATLIDKLFEKHHSFRIYFEFNKHTISILGTKEIYTKDKTVVWLITEPNEKKETKSKNVYMSRQQITNSYLDIKNFNDDAKKYLFENIIKANTKRKYGYALYKALSSALNKDDLPSLSDEEIKNNFKNSKYSTIYNVNKHIYCVAKTKMTDDHYIYLKTYFNLSDEYLTKIQSLGQTLKTSKLSKYKPIVIELAI